MDPINPNFAKDALGLIDNGFMFEDFAQNFLGQALNHNFIPAGGIKDRGIDGLQHIFTPSGKETYIYQMSIDEYPAYKLTDTLKN